MLPAFFEGTLKSEDEKKVTEWKEASAENRLVFEESKAVWEQTERLRKMQKYNAQKALESVNKKIERSGASKFIKLFQRIAAILIFPLLIATLYFSTKNLSEEISKDNWYTLKTGAGMRSEFVLPDGTEVFLNSNTILKYPVAFNGSLREVIIDGEAYFDVVKNKKQPFIVNTGDVNVEVTGTQFKVSNYESEGMTEVVLVEGAVRLFQGTYSGEKEMFKTLVPGEKARYLVEQERIYFEKVDTEKYVAWKDGKLMFRDDSMDEVVRRLNRWYNVDIQLTGHDLGDYVYTATFEDESLIQMLDLLKMSAPIDYKIKPRERKADNSFSKMKIEIIQQ